MQKKSMKDSDWKQLGKTGVYYSSLMSAYGKYFVDHCDYEKEYQLEAKKIEEATNEED